MKRISIFLRENQINNLEKLSKSKESSCSEMIREAIDYKILQNFSKNSRKDILKETLGLLKDGFDKKVKSKDLISGIRNEWEERVERIKK